MAVVFMDTSLDTHFVMVISDSDTVSDLKEKIIIQHRQIFPAIGDIKINSLKVKLRGKFYQLADSMPVMSAFVDTKKHGFILVDASLLELPWVSMMHPKLVNQIVPSVDSDSENIQESNSEKKMNYKSKKRTQEEDLVSKTQKVDKIFEHKNVICDKDLGDVLVVPSNVGLETHSEGCETVVADVFMVVEKIIQQNMSLEKKLVQKTDIGIEIPSVSSGKSSSSSSGEGKRKEAVEEIRV